MVEHTVLAGPPDPGCPHFGRMVRYKCAACGSPLCEECARSALLPEFKVCKHGCPPMASRAIEARFDKRYRDQLRRCNP